MNNKKLRYLVPALLLAGSLVPAYSQTALPYVLAGGGGSAAATGGNVIDFTLGEPFIATVGTNPRLTQGFHQPSTSGTPLWVQLLDFSGLSKKESNVLIWHTAMEKNSDRFVLERSTDGNRFTTLGIVYSKAENGYSTHLLAYTYTDRTMVENVNYYRLKQIGKDEKYSYSGIVRLERNAAAGSVQVSPNPAKNKIWLSIDGAFDKAGLQITDVTGRVMRILDITQSDTELDISSYAPGIYFIRYEDTEKTEIVKIIKQ
jgi:hypothetical protein